MTARPLHRLAGAVIDGVLGAGQARGWVFTGG